MDVMLPVSSETVPPNTMRIRVFKIKCIETNIRKNVYKHYHVGKLHDNQGLFYTIWLLETN